MSNLSPARTRTRSLAQEELDESIRRPYFEPGSETPPNERETSADAAEKGGPEHVQHEPVGILSPGLADTRAYIIKWWGLITLILATAIIGFLSLFWAANWSIEDNMSALNVWVVDFDGQVDPYTNVDPIVGPFIVEVAEALRQPSGTVGWESKPASDFNYDPMEVRRRVYHEEAWGAVIINANATGLLQQAVQTGNSSYEPIGAAQLVFVQARDQTTVSSYVQVQMEILTQAVGQAFGSMWAPQVLAEAANSTDIMANLQKAPQALSPAISFSMYNLRPFGPPVAQTAVTIGLIYLIIMAFFSFMFYVPFHMRFMAVPSPGRAPIKIVHLLLWRYFTTIIVYFFISLAYSFVALAYQVNFNAPPGSETEVSFPANGFHHASFFIYWMLNWLGMFALGMACENAAMVLGMPWTAFWLLFWIITNVSTAFYEISLEPGFYRWGYAWPLHNIVKATRTILFDTHSEIGKNVGILVAWCVVNTILFPIASMIMGKKTMAEKKKEHAYQVKLEERRKAYEEGKLN